MSAKAFVLLAVAKPKLHLGSENPGFHAVKSNLLTTGAPELHPTQQWEFVQFEKEKLMILGRFTLAVCLLTAPAMWAQYSKADMVKLASDRFDTTAKTLNLRPDQVAAIRPLIETKYIYIGQIKDVYMASDKSDTAKKTAKESLRAIHDKYNAKIAAILTPEQLKEWKHMQRDWRGDLSTPKS